MAGVWARRSYRALATIFAPLAALLGASYIGLGVLAVREADWDGLLGFLIGVPLVIAALLLFQFAAVGALPSWATRSPHRKERSAAG